MNKYTLLVIMGIFFTKSAAQSTINEDQTGAWYMYFGSINFGESNFGMQGDYQFRFWEPTGDLEQILLRTGFTYTPDKKDIKFTLGYANITSGTPGESSETSNESRIYQEALFSQKLGIRFYLTHRIRYEQRWVENQSVRTRYRYNLFINIPLNKPEITYQTIYLALYNEIFINGQKEIGDQRTVALFDRNRTYLGLGYGISQNLRGQLGWMMQTTNNWSKGQMQLSIHHSL